MRTFLTVIFWIVLIAWVAAIALFLVGNFGLFGSERDPLAGVFLIPIGLPWNRLFDVFGETFRPYLGIFAPAINLAIIWLVRSYWR